MEKVYRTNAAHPGPDRRSALKNFAGKINRQGKTSCDYIHMIGTKHEIYGSRGKILEKYWGYIFTFLDDTENDTDHR